MLRQLVSTLLLTAALWAQENFILHNENIIIDKAAVKLEKMCGELYEKTGVGVYISAVHKLGGQSIEAYESGIAANLKGSYVLLAFADLDQQVDMITSKDLAGVIDKDEILDGYIIPLIVEKRKDIGKQQQYTAGIFNGVAEITDRVAASRNVVLANSVGSGSKNFFDGLMGLIKLMLILTLAAFVYAYYKSKRDSKND